MSRLKKIEAKNGYESRNYKIKGESYQLDELEKIFNCMEELGHYGASRNITIGYDGDGGARLKFERIDKKTKLVSEEIDTQDNEFNFSIE